MRKIEFAPTAIPLSTFIAISNRNGYEFNDIYQRNSAWNKQLKEDLLFSIFANLPIGTIVINVNGDSKEIIKGIQRVSTLISFYNNELVLSEETSKKIVQFFIEELSSSTNPTDRKIYKAFNNDKFIRLNYKKLPDIMKEHFQNYLMSLIEIRYADHEMILEYFRLIQNAEKLKGREIIKALPPNRITSIFNEKEYQTMAAALNMNNKKDDLLKLMVQFHALYEAKLPLGASDKLIQSYAIKDPDILPAFECRMKLLYDKLTQYNGVVSPTKLNKSILKIIFLFVLYADEWREVTIDKFIQTIVNLYEENKFIFNSKNNTNIDEGIQNLLYLTRSNHYSDEVKDVMLHLDISKILK